MVCADAAYGLGFLFRWIDGRLFLGWGCLACARIARSIFLAIPLAILLDMEADGLGVVSASRAKDR